MTVPDFSVLLLAWDEADPAVTVLGGAVLPPTLPLVYQLAARQPVLAVYPHLPPDDRADPDAASAAPGEAAAATELAAAGATGEAAALPTPGVRRLPGPPPLAGAPAGAPAAPASRLVGLAELLPVLPPPLVPDAPAAVHGVAPAAGRRQWPTGPYAPVPAPWQAPAAPYVGAGPAAARPVFAAAVAPPAPAGGPAAALPEPTEPTEPPVVRSAHPTPTADGRSAPGPALPAPSPTAAFDDAPPEIGPAEAADLSVPEDDLSPEATETAPALAPAAITAAAGAAGNAPPTAPPAPPALNFEGLNFRMIEYARRAVQLVQGRADFAVIYAPGWPAWLAALEIRNRTGCPLVLYVAALAADFAAPAERGWLLEIERMALRRAHTLLVPDAALAARLRAQYGSGLGRVQVAAADDEAAVRRALAAAAGAGNLLADV